MANDLERFLQQAAQRLAEKLNQGQPPKAKPRPPTARPERNQERQRLHRETLEPEIVDAALVEARNPRELGPDPLSNIDTRPGLAQEISLADEKMAEHVHDVLDHQVMNLGNASNAFRGAQGSVSNVGSKVQHRNRSVSPLVSLLRQPETLRAAFLAGEIFKPKF